MRASDLESGIRLAKIKAREALDRGEIPVGAVVLDASGNLVSSASNRVEELQDQLAHAEVLCISEASKKTPGKRLNGYSLIVTLEPCLMCLGAAIDAGISRVYYLVDSPDSGAFSKFRVKSRIEEHRLDDHEAKGLLKSFFKTLR